MKQITIRGIPEEVQKIIKKEASRKRTSLNKAVVSLLEKAAGTGESRKKRVRYHDLDHFAGLWAREEAEAFNKALDSQRGIDEDLWKKTK